MSGKKTLQCIRCDKELDDISTFQPNDGLCFLSCGHYGSTFFDPNDGSYLEIVVCDECLTTAKTIRTVDYKKQPDEFPGWDEIEKMLSSDAAWTYLDDNHTV